jgi:hypothetical protein
MKSEHPDANLLAAFMEKRLFARERERVLAHLAECADCRELLSLAALSSEPAAAASEPVPARPVAGMWRWAAAAAAVALIAVAGWGLRLILQPARSDNSARIVAMNRPIETTPQPLPAKMAPPAQFTSGQPGARELRPPKHLKTPAKLQEPVPQERRLLSEPSPKTLEPAPLSLEPAQAAQQAVAPSDQLDRAVAEQARQTPELAPPLQPQAPQTARALAGRDALALGVKKRLSFPANSKAFAPARVLWRVSAPTLLRSSDGGVTWRPVSLGEGADVRAVTSGDSDVWAGGARGALWHSSDGGLHWRQVAVSDGRRQLTGNIVAIRCPQPLEIVLETDSDEQWISRDGGVEWFRL